MEAGRCHSNSGLSDSDPHHGAALRVAHERERHMQREHMPRGRAAQPRYAVGALPCGDQLSDRPDARCGSGSVNEEQARRLT